MLTFVVALLAGAAVSAVFRFSGILHSTPAAIAPGVVVFLVTLVVIFRRIGNGLNPIVEEATRHLQGGRRELALKALRSGLRFATWHPLIEGQLRMQIGALKYAEGDLDEAVSELSRASKKPWESRGFLGAAHFKKKNDEAMEKAFDDAIKSGEKDGLSFTVYAWCLLQRNKKEKAIEVLKKGVEKLPSDARLKANLELVQEGKKMKVAPYGDKWAAFMLDGSMPGASNIPKAARGFAQRPGFRQRPQRKR
jgi:tetratricopeptide (TPR) repeat protein